MIGRVFILAVLAVAIGGCVLQSRTPRYGDHDAILALGKAGGVAVMSNWQDGAWVADAEQIEIKVDGQHYEAISKTGNIGLTFVAIQGPWFVLQGTDGDHAAVYMLAEIRNGGAEIRPLACRDLKTNTDVAAAISFEGDDCYIKPDAEMKPIFAALLASPEAASSRLEIKS